MTRHHYIIEFSMPGKLLQRFRTNCAVLVTENMDAKDIQLSLEGQACRYIKETIRVDASSNWLEFHLIAHVHTTNK